MKLFKRIIATLLVLTMILTIQPETFGLLSDNIAKAADKEALDVPYCIPEDFEETSKFVKRIKEDEDEYTIIYENEDGSFTMYSFARPVQYIDSDGKLKDYDPRIKEIKDKSKNDSGYVYEITSSDVSVLLPSDLVSNKYITIELDKYKVDFKPVTDYDNTDKVKNGDSIKDEYKAKKIEKDNDNIGVEYLSAVSSNITHKYYTTNFGVKEEVVFYEAPESSIMQFEMKIKGVIPELKDTGEMIFYDEDTMEQVGQMTPLFMYDSYIGNGDDENDIDGPHMSQNVRAELVQDGNNKNKYILTVYLDEELLYDPSTVYPVTLDPDIYFHKNAYKLHDTYVCSGRDANYVGATSNYVGKGSAGIFRSYFLMDLPSTYRGYYLIHCYYVAWNAASYTSNAIIDCHRVTSPWSAYSIRWSNRASYDSGVVSANVVNDGGGAYYVWNLLPIANQWSQYILTNGASGYPNYGFMLKERAEDTKLRWFMSTENPYSNPYVRLVYYQDDVKPGNVSSLLATPNAGIVNSGKGSITLNWPEVTDTGTPDVSGTKDYELTLYEGSVASGTKIGDCVYVIDNGGSSFTHTFEDLDDNTTYQCTIRARDKAYNLSGVTESNIVTLVDRTKPSDVSILNITSAGGVLNSGTGTITVNWPGTTDIGSSGMAQYKLALFEGTVSGGAQVGSVITVPDTGAADYTHTFQTQLDDSKTYQCSIVAEDNEGNFSGVVESSTITLPDRTGPSAPTTFTIDSTGWTNNTTPTITWSGIEDNTVGNISIEYTTDGGLTWSPTQWTGVSGSGTFSADAFIVDGEYSIQIRGVDSEGNLGDASTVVNYQRDNTSPIVEITSPVSSHIDDSAIIEGTAYDQGETNSGIAGWILEYGSGMAPTSWTTIVTGETIEAEWDTSQLPLGDYTIRLTVTDNAGNPAEDTMTVTRHTFAVFEAGTLDISSPIDDADFTDSTQTDIPVTFTWNDESPCDTLIGSLYIDGEKADEESTIGEGLTFDISGLYEGSAHNIFIIGEDTNGEKYCSEDMYETTFTDEFVTDPYAVLDGAIYTQEKIILADEGGVYYVAGTVISEFANNIIPGYVYSAELTVNDSTANDTNIEYYISFDGENWQIITPGTPTEITAPMVDSSVKIKAVLSTNNGLYTPELYDWSILLNSVSGANLNMFTVNLVDVPMNVEATPDANYMTLVDWDDTNGEGTLYNVYRGSTSDFVPSSSNLAAEDVNQTFWYDYNLDYSQTFYYKVTAKMTVNQIERESVPSLPSNAATVVDANELEKMLGLQDYWKYSSFRTGSGNGYINVASGNMVYTSVDSVYPGMLLAMVMRRTYNSQATTKTTMGYGWDFSYNTCLLRETDGDMILKDGDGTLHLFTYNSSTDTYNTPAGVFMELIHDSENGWYKIDRKDNISYIFDENMKLLKMTEFDRNYIAFGYNESGKLEIAEMKCLPEVNINESTYAVATFLYYQNADSSNTITYTTNTEKVGLVAQMTDPSGRVFNYEYDSTTGYLATSTLDIPGTTTDYTESYSYVSGTHRISDVYDAENKHTHLSYSGDKVSGVTFPVSSESYSIAYGTGTTTLTDSWNHATVYEYDSNGCVTGITNALNDTTSYTYNAKLQVTGMSYYNYIDGSSTATEQSYAFTYSAAGNISTVTDPLNHTTYYDYYNAFNQAGRVRVQLSASEIATTWYNYDDNNYLTGDSGEGNTGNLLTATDAEGNVTTYTYNTDGTVATVTSSLGSQTQYTYYDTVEASGAYYGWVKEIKQGKAGGSMTTVTTVLAYDAQGNPVEVEDGEGNVVKTIYDTLGRLTKTYLSDNTSATWADNNYTEIYYDMNHNVVRTVGVSVPGSTQGLVTTYTYDDMDRLTGTTVDDANYNTNGLDLESTISYGTYTRNGNPCRVVINVDAEDNMSFTYYDELGRLIMTAVTDRTTPKQTGHYVYDKVGNVIMATDSEGLVVQARYDALNRQIHTITDPTGENITTTAVYNYVGMVTSATDGEGNVTSYTYDKLGRIKSVTQDPDTAVTGDEATTTYAYDLSEGSYTQAVVKNTITDANGNVKETYLDAMGRAVVDVNLGDGLDSNEMVVMRTFNDNGQVATITNVDNQVDTYAYNNWGQITSIEYGNADNDSDGHVDNRTVYSYDDVGRMDEMTDYRADTDNNTVVNSVTTTWSYDDLSRVNQFVQDGSEVTYEYNDVSQVTSVTYMSDVSLGQSSPTTTLGYTYDGYGRLSAITKDSDTARTYTYTTGGFKVDYMTDYLELDTSSTAQMQTDYTYNSLGLVSGIAYIDTAPATDVTKESYTYTYDDRGYILTEELNTNYSGTNTVSKSYEYDGIGRLTQSTEGSTITSYEYDEVGNRTKLYDGTDPETANEVLVYKYNEFNQLDYINENGTLYADYSYDARGAQISEAITGGDTTTYTYDAAGNLSKTDDGTDITKHFYNGSGQRLKKEENSSITNYYYSGSAVLFTTNVDNDKLTENILTPGGSIVASMRFEGDYADEYYFFNYDIRQSVTSIVDDSFTLMQGYEYDDFGNKTVTGDAGFLNEVTFTGAVEDSTGLYYMNARFYDPNTGRFLTQDSYTGNAYEPWSQHLYSYTGNNPINYVDPTGHYFAPPWLLDGTAKHRAIQMEMVMRFGARYEVEVIGGSKKLTGYSGYIDVVIGNQAYEIKPASLYGYATGKSEIDHYIMKAQEQGKRYTLGESLAAEMPCVDYNNGKLWLTYEPGVIYYTYQENPKIKQPTVAFEKESRKVTSTSITKEVEPFGQRIPAFPKELPAPINQLGVQLATLTIVHGTSEVTKAIAAMGGAGGLSGSMGSYASAMAGGPMFAGGDGFWTRLNR